MEIEMESVNTNEQFSANLSEVNSTTPVCDSDQVKVEAQNVNGDTHKNAGEVDSKPPARGGDEVKVDMKNEKTNKVLIKNVSDAFLYF
jgi:hypothetical protein